MIELAHVGVRIGERVLLEDVTLTVPRGRTLAVVGPSGAGKSTLLRVLTGLVLASAGEVRIDGVVLSAASAPSVRSRIGYVVQEGGLFPHLRAADNVTLAARDRGWPRHRCEARLRELAALVRLPVELFARYPAELSGGQRQRVALARALALDPSVLLLDEPFAALDPAVRLELEDELAALARQLGKTQLLVTHDLGEALRLGDDVAVLRAGRVEQVGPPDELLARPATPFVSAFLRSTRPGPGGAA